MSGKEKLGKPRLSKVRTTGSDRKNVQTEEAVEEQKERVSELPPDLGHDRDTIHSDGLEVGQSGIVWRTERRRIGDLIEWAGNPRKLTKKQASDLQASIDKFGYVEEVVLNADGKHIIGGHQRRKILIHRAMVDPTAEIDVRIPSRQLTDDEAVELAIRLNKNTGEWDYEILANEFHTPQLFSWGFEPKEFELEDASTEMKPTSMKPASEKTCPECGAILP